MQLGRSRQSFARSGCLAFAVCGSVAAWLEKEAVTLFLEDYLLVAKLEVLFYVLLLYTREHMRHEERE